MSSMDWGSDGSDYGSLMMEDDDASMSSSQDSLSSSFEPEFLPILPKPNWPDPSLISVEQLDKMITTHLRNSTLRRALTQIDTSGVVFMPHFSEPSLIPEGYFTNSEVLDEAQDKLRRTPKLTMKTCGTMLHYACHDPDSKRGEEKIKRILKAAKTVDLSVARICSINEVHLVPRNNGRWEELEDPDDEKQGFGTTRNTPFYTLLRARKLGAIRILASAWPRIVNLRDIRKQEGYSVYGETYTTLLELIYDHFAPAKEACNDLAIVETILEFAERTPLGARGLVATSFRWPTGFHWQEGEDMCEHEEELCTVVHICLSCRKEQPELITPIIRAWPEALIHCGDMMEEQGSYPLHIVWKNPTSYGLAVQFTENLLSNSVIEGVATALLNTNVDGKLGLAKVLQTMPVPMTPENQRLRKRLIHFMESLRDKKDEKGRTLLHYIAANECRPNARELYFQQLKFSDEYWRQTGRGNASLDIPELPPAGILAWNKEKHKLQERNDIYKAQVINWILRDDPELAYVQDKDGLNPFHYALKQGMTWNAGLEALVNDLPEWAESYTKQGLLPYQLAATQTPSDGELDTIYHLLKFVGRM
ncbi:unnamed protein product [Cylindrotheca closterium]|uniref:Uncharacterized protein n=1 Tax=Cylindrotheca closterium TaxID=2856 RepID=A0AAD2JJM1_9STRA|nr:unnamed protein product [Cylindrotheca closterium]